MGWSPARRMQREGFDAGIPVLCVGNYHVGGAGKTPTVLALTKLLRDLGETPVVLSRGYGGRLRGPVKVDPERHAAADVGDEPLMLARTVPVVVARDRIDGVALARSQGASVILMDDGFQNPAIAKDASLIVIDGDRGLGNGRVFPAGPLRAPLPPQLARTDALIVVGDGTAADGGCGRHRRAGQAGAVGASAGRTRRRWRRCAASVCWPLPGSAIPPGFSGRCAQAASRSSRERAFADHHPFSQGEIEEPDRGGQTRWADAGDDGKGSGAAAQRRGRSGLGAGISCRSR